MRSNSIGVESNNCHNRAYTSTVNKSLAFKNNSNQYYNVKVIHHVSSTDDFIETQTTKNSNEVRCDAKSIYDNYNGDIKFENEHDKSRRSREQDQWYEKYLYGNKSQVKRDHSMPPISGREKQFVDDNILSQYSFAANKYSIEGDLDTPDNIFDDNSTDMYDSVITNVSITPPPVHMIHEYANRKAIIRPLAFRPVQSDRSRHLSESSPTKPPISMKNKISQVRRVSPPPVPPHSSRVSLKSNFAKVQSLKSGDSSGYYSSRTVCTANGNTSSTDISPTFDDNGSMIDSVTAGDIYANTIDLINNYQLEDGLDQETFTSKPSLESEIVTERERNQILEAALSKSSAKLVNAESQINDLKGRLLQKSAEVNSTKENLIHCKRSLEHQSQKAHNLELSIKSIKYDISKEKITKEKTTQTNLYNGDYATNNLLEQFEEERRTWLNEKLKVLTYQKQIETNFQKLLQKSRRLESQLGQMKSQVKDCRSQQSYPSNHSDDNEKSSLKSGDSSGRNYLSNINRIESTEHQASF